MLVLVGEADITGFAILAVGRLAKKAGALMAEARAYAVGFGDRRTGSQAVTLLGVLAAVGLVALFF
jgi:hypothetical protein